MNSRNKGIFLSYLYTFLNMLFGLFLSSYLLRMLGDTEYGIYQTITAFVNYLILLEFGVGTVLTRNILVYRNKNETEKIKNVVSTMYIISIFLSLVILIFAFIFFINLSNVYQNTLNNSQIIYAKKIFFVTIFQLISSFFSQTVSGVLLGMENYSFSQVINIIKVLSRTIVLVVLIWFKPYAIIIASVDAIISILVLIIIYIYVKNKYKIEFKIKYFDFGIVKESLPLCVAILIQAFVNQANNNVDKTIIGIMISVESVAIYSISQYIYSVFSSLCTIPITMYMPQVSKDIQKGLSGKEFTNTLIQPCRLVVVIGSMIVCGFFAVGKQFITLVYGATKTEAWIYALVIMVPMFINMTNGIIINILDVLNKRIVRSFALLGTTILNIMLTVIFIPYLGILGAVVATAISTVLGQIILMNLYYYKKLNLDIIYLFKKSYQGILIYVVVSSILSFYIANLFSNVFLSLIIGGILFIVLSISSILFFGLNDYEKQKLKDIIRLKNK